MKRVPLLYDRSCVDETLFYLFLCFLTNPSMIEVRFQVFSRFAVPDPMVSVNGYKTVSARLGIQEFLLQYANIHTMTLIDFVSVAHNKPFRTHLFVLMSVEDESIFSDFKKLEVLQYNLGEAWCKYLGITKMSDREKYGPFELLVQFQFKMKNLHQICRSKALLDKMTDQEYAHLLDSWYFDNKDDELPAKFDTSMFSIDGKLYEKSIYSNFFADCFGKRNSLFNINIHYDWNRSRMFNLPR